MSKTVDKPWRVYTRGWQKNPTPDQALWCCFKSATLEGATFWVEKQRRSYKSVASCDYWIVDCRRRR